MDKKDLNRLSHMLDAAKAITQHIADKSLSDLEQNRLLLGGIIRELLLIGEAANAVSSHAKTAIPNIPWREIIGMRNQLIHGYFDLLTRANPALKGWVNRAPRQSAILLHTSNSTQLH